MAGEEYGTEEIRPDFAFLTSGNLAIQRTGVDKEKLAVDDRMENVKRRCETKKGLEIEAEGTHAYQNVLRELGRPSPKIDPVLEHILITGMFHTFFELVIHEMPLRDAENYVKEMRAFYTAGWMKIMGQ